MSYQTGDLVYQQPIYGASVDIGAKLTADIAANLAVDFTPEKAEAFQQILHAIRDLDRSSRYPPRQYSLLHTIGGQSAVSGIGDFREMTQGPVIIRIAQLYFTSDVPADTVVTIRGLLPGFDLQFERAVDVSRVEVGQFMLISPQMQIAISSTAGAPAGSAILTLLTIPLDSGRW